MTVKQTVEDGLSRPMSRRAFLGQVGALQLAVVGVSAMLKSLSGTESSGARASKVVQPSRGEYGGSAYRG